MPAPLVPSPLDYVGRRRFAFYPPVKNAETKRMAPRRRQKRPPLAAFACAYRQREASGKRAVIFGTVFCAPTIAGVDRNAAKVGGAWCFAGARLPVLSLFDHLDKGGTVDEFLEWFPDVSRTQIHEVLEFAKASLERPAAVA
jgi:uncharacterized protein (DUF433 family)